MAHCCQIRSVRVCIDDLPLRQPIAAAARPSNEENPSVQPLAHRRAMKRKLRWQGVGRLRALMLTLAGPRRAFDYNPAGDKLGSIATTSSSTSAVAKSATLSSNSVVSWGWAPIAVQCPGVVPPSKAKLEGAPRYVEGDVPAYTPEYRRRVHD